MAGKITELGAAGAMDDADLFELVQSGANKKGLLSALKAFALAPFGANGLQARTAAGVFSARTVTGGLGTTVTNGDGVAGNPTIVRANGTSFPGSPAPGDLFWRSDRKLEYVYDGTRWLSTQLFVFEIATQDGLNPISATAADRNRMANPFTDATNGYAYDFYIEKFIFTSYNSSTTATNYFTADLRKTDGASATSLGTLNGQNDTQSAFVAHVADINQVIASSIELLSVSFTETGAVATGYATVAVTGRLVG